MGLQGISVVQKASECETASDAVKVVGSVKIMHHKSWEFNFETYAMKENSFKINYQIVLQLLFLLS